MTFSRIKAILFDKDGTLFDFSASWSGWTHALIEDLAAGDAARMQVLAEVLEFDLATVRFEQTSPVIAGTVDESAELLLPHLSGMSFEDLREYLIESAAQTEMIEALPLVPFLDGLVARDLVLGVATNDGAAPALAHLSRAGILSHFAHVLGYDSGYTPKPAPDMLLGFAARTGLACDTILMVGDSTHDLIAGRAAGMPTIGVLTGMAGRAELAPHADIVVPDIGYLPQVLGYA